MLFRFRCCGVWFEVQAGVDMPWLAFVVALVRRLLGWPVEPAICAVQVVVPEGVDVEVRTSSNPPTSSSSAPTTADQVADSRSVLP